MKIEHTDKLGATDGYSWCHMAHAELLREGMAEWVDAQAYSHTDSAAIARTDAGELMGVIAWQILEHRMGAFINMSFVRPEFRRKGVYLALYAAVVAKAREKKCVSIESGIGPTNVAMRRIAEGQGRSANMTVYKAQL